jgi:predicted SAM-dependent methyltransferase
MSHKNSHLIQCQGKNMTHNLVTHPHSHFAAINLACGGKLCKESGWINADHNPSTGNVMALNLLKPLPFVDNTFDVVYHSQFIEHLPYDMGLAFMKECFRILKPNGVLRVVTPDLQNQAAEYLRNLQTVLNSPKDENARQRYEWIRLEMLDQLTRHTSGGDMVNFLQTSGRNIRDYLIERMGRSGENLIPSTNTAENRDGLKEIARHIKNSLRANLNKLIPESRRVGRFRLSGESHLCMYDEYLLSTLLTQCGFTNSAKVGAKESKIPNWDLTQLDSDQQGKPDCEVSLFMEAVKPANN